MIAIDPGFPPGAHFVVVFDAAQKPIAWWFPAAGLVFVLFGVLLWITRDDDSPQPFSRSTVVRRPGPRKLGRAAFLGFSVFWTVGAAAGIFGQALFARLDLSSGHLPVVEGRVEHFSPMLAAVRGAPPEEFQVGDVHFAYSANELRAGFNQTASDGGPIREGLYVRIHYTGPKDDAEILRLEIARP